MALTNQDAIELAIEYVDDHMDLDTDPTGWTVVSSNLKPSTHGEKSWHIELSHNDVDETIHVVCHERGTQEDAYVIEGDELLYDIGSDPSMAPHDLYIVFCPKSYWEREGHIPSDELHEHQGDALMLAFNLPRNIAENEAMEGAFCLPTHLDMAGAHSLMQSLGYQHRDMSIGTPQQLQQQAHPEAKVKMQQVISQLVYMFKQDDPLTTGNEIHVGDILEEAIKDLDKHEQAAIRQGIWPLLAKYGVPHGDVNVFDASDRAQILKRITRSIEDPAAKRTGDQVSYVLQSAQPDTRPPVDVTGMSMEELYRKAIRGEIPQIKAIGWRWCNEGEGPATEDEIAWYCGYVDEDGRLMKDIFIPDDVLARWFPEYKQITWNDYEKEGMTNYHTMPSPPEQYVEGFKSIIHSRYADKGLKHLEDLTDPVDQPLVPKAQRVAAGAPPSAPVAAPTGGNYQTLKAYPAGHTGRATPAPQPAAAPEPVQEAPQNTNELVSPVKLWREYQADMGALAEHGIKSAGYQIVNTTPQVVFALGFLDDSGRVVENIPQDEILRLFPEYTITCLDEGITYRINKMFGQQLSELEHVVKERLTGVKIFDVTA